MIRKVIVTVLLVLTIALLIGCAAEKALWGDPKSGLILTYRMGEGEVLQYQMSAEQTQELDMMGQTMETETKSNSKFTATSKGKKEGNLMLGITMDDMKIHVSSMQGDMSPDMKGVIGKSFDMTLSPLGKEVDVSGAKELTYNMGEAGKRSLKSSFSAIFPDAAGKPVKVGDTWTSKDEITEDESGLNIKIVFDGVDTFEGFETVNGMECARITSKVKGTINGEGQQMGQDLKLEGDIDGTGTWYFAYKKGCLVKMTIDSFMEGNVVVIGQNMTIPMTQESKQEIVLVQ